MRRILLVLIGVLALGACRHETLIKQPLMKTVGVEDLLRSATFKGEGPAAEAPLLRVDTSVRKGKILHVAGLLKAPEKPGESREGSVEFSASLGGRVIFRKNYPPGCSREVFDQEIDLGNFAGTQARLVFQIRAENGNNTDARWRFIRMEDRRRVRRKTAGAGPNILFLLVDTFRAAEAGIYGYSRPTTPNLDRFAQNALVFDHAVSPAAWTLPSVASMMTGKYSLCMNAVDGIGLSQRDTTLAEVLINNGVTTAGFSANPLIDAVHAFDQGFETFEHFPWADAGKVNRHFEKWLDRAGGLQWFAYLHYIDPHDPYHAPEGFGRFHDPSYDGVFRSPGSLLELANAVNFDREAPFDVDKKDLEYLQDCYDEEIHYWDAEFGRLLTLLEKKGLVDNTIIVVVADHGEAFAEHGKYKHGQQVYEEAVHVPLLLSIPGRKGRVSGTVETRLIAGTLLKLLEIKVPMRMQGDLLENHDDRAAVYTRYGIDPDDPRTRRALFALFDGHWKYINDVGRNREELYDLSSDPGERVDRAAREDDVISRFHKALEDFRAHCPDKRHRELAPDETTIEELRALGYVR